MRLLRVLLILILLSPLSAAIYYVDATLGGDGGTGGIGDPWQTIDKVNNSLFNPGDSILFKRGEVWRGTTLLDTCENHASAIDGGSLVPPSDGSIGSGYVTFGAYGEGADPELNGSIDVTSDSWTEDGANDWYVNVDDNSDLQFTILFVWLDDTVEGDEKGAKVNLSNKYDWWYDAGNDRLYVYAVGDPDGYYTGVEGVIHRWGIRVGGVTWGQVRQYIEIVNIKVIKFYRRGIRVGYGGPSHHLTFEDIEVGYIGDDPSSNNFIVGYESNNVLIRRVESHHNVVQHGIYVDTGDYVTIEYCDIHDNNSSAIQFNNNSSSRCINPIVRYNKLYDNGTCGIQDMAADSGEYYYNLMYRNDDAGVKLNADVAEGGVAMNSTDCIVYNNVIYNHGSRGLYIAVESTGHLIKNNIIVHSGVNEIVRVNPLCNGTFDNNCYFGDQTDTWTWQGAGCGSFAIWKATSSQDTNSRESDPLFVTPGSDFHIQVGSPCKDDGTNVGLTVDHFGNLVPSGAAQDMGAHEYQQGDIPVLRIRDVLRIRNILRIK